MDIPLDLDRSGGEFLERLGLSPVLEGEADRHGEKDLAGLAADDEGLVLPLLDGIDGRLIERGDGAEDAGIDDVALFVGLGFEDDDTFDAGFAGLIGIDGIDQLDDLGRLDIPHGPDGVALEPLLVLDPRDPALHASGDDAALDTAFDSSGDAADDPARPRVCSCPSSLNRMVTVKTTGFGLPSMTMGS